MLPDTRPSAHSALRLLALETSSERLSVAVATATQVFARDVDAGQQHSVLALGVIDELLSEAQLSAHDLNMVAFGQGPGSFVGVRIACGLAQGVALGADARVVPVATTLALAEHVARVKAAKSPLDESLTVLVAIDARLGELYLAAYRQSDAVATGWEIVMAPMLASVTSLPKVSGVSLVGIGSAFAVPMLRDALTHVYGAQLVTVVRDALPSAVDVARIAQRQLEREGTAAAFAPEDVAPLYLRNNIALTVDERLQLRTSAARDAMTEPGLAL
jgi:tRNA threonylcarbamoyladenosine biosynthesis protein TsaB